MSLGRKVSSVAKLSVVKQRAHALPGWLAQWEEMIRDKEQKIARPRQVYTGPAERNFVPMAKRK